MTTNLNLHFIHDDNSRDFSRWWLEERFTSIDDIVDYYRWLCHLGERYMTRSDLNNDAIKIGITDYKSYKTKTLLLDAIHQNWVIFFHENINQLEEKGTDKQFLLEIKNRINLYL